MRVGLLWLWTSLEAMTPWGTQRETQRLDVGRTPQLSVTSGRQRPDFLLLKGLWGHRCLTDLGAGGRA